MSKALLFSEAISGIPTHNYLNQAYHDARVHFLCPPYDLHWKVPALAVPLKVRRRLSLAAIVGDLKGQIAAARVIVDEYRDVLDVEMTRRIHYTPDGPYPWAHPSIVVTRHEREGYASGWDYTFNPYSLGHTLLDDYERFIDKMVKSRLSQFTRIARIHQMAEGYRASVQLVDSELSFQEVTRPGSW